MDFSTVTYGLQIYTASQNVQALKSPGKLTEYFVFLPKSLLSVILEIASYALVSCEIFTFVEIIGA